MNSTLKKMSPRILVFLSFSWSLLAASEALDTLRLRISPENYSKGMSWVYEGRKIEVKDLSEILIQQPASHKDAIDAIRYARYENNAGHCLLISAIPTAIIGVWLVAFITTLGSIQPPPDYSGYILVPCDVVALTSGVVGLIYRYKSKHRYIKAIKAFNGASGNG